MKTVFQRVLAVAAIVFLAQNAMPTFAGAQEQARSFYVKDVKFEVKPFGDIYRFNITWTVCNRSPKDLEFVELRYEVALDGYTDKGDPFDRKVMFTRNPNDFAAGSCHDEGTHIYSEGHEQDLRFVTIGVEPKTKQTN
jgi:hypothetical protein